MPTVYVRCRTLFVLARGLFTPLPGRSACSDPASVCRHCVSQFVDAITGRRDSFAVSDFPIAARQDHLAVDRFPIAAKQFPIAAGQNPIAADQLPIAADRIPIAAN